MYDVFDTVFLWLVAVFAISGTLMILAIVADIMEWHEERSEWWDN